MSQDAPSDRDRQAHPTQTAGGAPEWGMRLEPGNVVGDRYEIFSLLGCGGMGEVWHAFDLKLRVEVALKALRPEFFRSERRLELLHQEVRAARDVTSPNVCRVFDLVEVEGRELVSMEYVDGDTLLAVLQERGPLELKEAQDIASQFLAGLEAIHRAGLIHRDIKPENIMLTRAGRVVVMDFGLARQEAEGGGSVSGTPAYMAPEQAAGQTLDARTDVYAAGVVLAEMVCPEGIKNIQSRQSVWEGVRSEPAKVPDTPWAPVIKKAVAKDREGRYNSAHTLTRALEDVTLRVEGAEDLHPYPGLASFTEAEAEYFFGREAEVERMWRKLEGPARLLALVGPSGAGKSSFIRAGLFAAAPANWSYLVSTPGHAAISSLGRIVAREMAGDPDVAEKMMDFEDPDVAVEVLSRWRSRTDHALLVVDQFEELFAQNSIEEQHAFAELLSRVVLEADVCVVLSMRDDFLMRCRDVEALEPTFADMTALPTLAGHALRRALVRPATKCGYRFEENELVEEMLAEVEGERGALPLLAFAAAQLWERRDRDAGLLTREAYQEIGGVGGALAQHAEATIDRIGGDRIRLVRELFRNLVTAEGTRAVREWGELLSVFDDSQRQSAEQVLRALIDARLLTSYEVTEEDREPTRRVEIIHESLLANWPRLVRWQTQDQEGAQLRDELRQAARLWDEHDRFDDRLWTGTAYREFQLWRERYPGGLTQVEEAFAHAMESYATRRRRRRRLAAMAGFAVLLAVLAVVTTLWRRSVLETRRAEAAKLLALGEVELDSYPTAALAWATASLELSDTLEGRLLALRALYRGPPVTVDPAPESRTVSRCVFSPNGEWLARNSGGVHLRFNDGSQPVAVGGEPLPRRSAFVSDDLLITEGKGVHQWWSLKDLATPQWTEEKRGFLRAVRGDGYFSYSTTHPDYPSYHVLGDVAAAPEDWDWIHRWPLDGGSPRLVGGMEDWGWDGDDIDSKGRWLVYPRGNAVYLRSLLDWSHPPLRLGEFGQKVNRASFRPDGQQIAAVDEAGEVRIWRWRGGSAEAVRRLKLTGVFGDLAYGAAGRWLALSSTNRTGGGTRAWLVDLTAPLGAAPLELRRSEIGYADAPGHMAFHPSGAWLAVPAFYTVGFWPLSHPYPRVFDHGGPVGNVKFTPDGRWLLSVSEVGDGPGGDGQLRAWPLDGQNGGASRVLLEQPDQGFFLADLEVDPSGEHVAVGSGARGGRVYIVPIAGGPPRELEPTQGAAAGQLSYELAYSPDGKLLASVPINTFANPELNVEVWDLGTGDSRVLGPVGRTTSSLRFVDDRRLVWTGLNQSGEVTEERSIDLGTGAVEVVSEEGLLRGGYEGIRVVSPSGSLVLKIGFVHTGTSDDTELYTTDLGTGETRHITTHGDDPFAIALDPTEQVMVTGGVEHGPVRVGPVSGDEPYLLYGHQGGVEAVAVSPDRRWIASGGDDSTLRLWPMPDPSKPPFHILPHDQLIATLHTLTNLNAVRDEESSTGWKVEVGPFSGWAEVPDW